MTAIAIGLILMTAAVVMITFPRGESSGSYSYSLGVGPNQTTMVVLGEPAGTLVISFNATTPIYLQVMFQSCTSPGGCYYPITSDYGTTGLFDVPVPPSNTMGIEIDLTATAPSVVSLEVHW